MDNKLFFSLLIALFFCSLTRAQTSDSVNSPLIISNNLLLLNNTLYPNNIYLKGTIFLNKVLLPENDLNYSNIYAGINDSFIRKYLEEEAIKNNLIRFIQNSAPKKESDELTAIRKYLGISRDIFALILAIIHVVTY